MSSKLTPQEYNTVVQQVSDWIFKKTNSSKAVEEAKQFVNRIESQTTSKEDFLKTINEKFERLQSKQPLSAMDNIKWIMDKKDVLQNILTNFESKIAVDKSYEKNLSVVAREGIASLKKILSLDIRPNVQFDGTQYMEDVLRIKKSLTELRDIMKDRSQENAFLEDESVFIVILMQYFMTIEQMKTDRSCINGIFSTGKWPSCYHIFTYLLYRQTSSHENYTNRSFHQV
jgi:hypothetical protein